MTLLNYLQKRCFGKKGDYDENWLQESKYKMLKQIDDEKKANLNMSRVKKQMNRQ